MGTCILPIRFMVKLQLFFTLMPAVAISGAATDLDWTSLWTGRMPREQSRNWISPIIAWRCCPQEYLNVFPGSWSSYNVSLFKYMMWSFVAYFVYSKLFSIKPFKIVLLEFVFVFDNLIVLECMVEVLRLG